MDTWKFYDITHREHLVCNPTNEEKLTRLVEILRLPRGARVIDIASGKGEFLVRLAEAYDVNGLGIDISPFCTADARKKLAERAPDSAVTFTQMDGRNLASEAPSLFALAACIGASWIFGGHHGTLEALTRMVEPGGWVIAGEPFWLREPSADYLKVSGDRREDFGTHAENVEAGERLGLRLVHTLVSSRDDWDRYEGLQWYAADSYAREHPEDPDLPEVIERVARSKSAFLREGRETLGWAIYAFRRPPGGDE
jgi:SAM-dependent methyltransferase